MGARAHVKELTLDLKLMYTKFGSEMTFCYEDIVNDKILQNGVQMTSWMSNPDDKVNMARSYDGT